MHSFQFNTRAQYQIKTQILQLIQSFKKQAKRMKPWVYENQHKVTQVFLMLKLLYTKTGVMLLKTNFLTCPTRMGGPYVVTIPGQNYKIFEFTSLSLFSSSSMEFLHMPKELNGLSDRVLSHWFSMWKSSHASVGRKTGQWRRRGRDEA